MKKLDRYIKRVEELQAEKKRLKWWQFLKRNEIDLLIASFIQSLPYALIDDLRDIPETSEAPNYD